MSAPSSPVFPPDSTDAGRLAPSDPYTTPWATAPVAAPPQANPYDTAPYGATPYSAAGSPAWGPVPGFAVPHTNGLAIASLVTSLSAVLLPLTGLVGLILGIVALHAIRRDGTQGRGLAIAGIAVGAVFTVMAIGAIILMIAMYAGVWSGLGDPGIRG